MHEIYLETDLIFKDISKKKKNVLLSQLFKQTVKRLSAHTCQW